MGGIKIRLIGNHGYFKSGQYRAWLETADIPGVGGKEIRLLESVNIPTVGIIEIRLVGNRRYSWGYRNTLSW